MATPFDIIDLKRRMDGAFEALRKEFAGLRTGRASSALLDPVMVEAYGSSVPLAQVGTVNVPEPRMLSVQVWDKSQIKAVEKAIRDAGLGLNPQSDGQVIRIPLPELSEERRRELTKVARTYAENAKVAVRNVRRDGMERLKKLEKEGSISEDAQRQHSDEVQSQTDTHIKKIDETLAAKEAEIMQV